jgi:hypothetical protein
VFQVAEAGRLLTARYGSRRGLAALFQLQGDDDAEMAATHFVQEIDVKPSQADSVHVCPVPRT